ncbi:MAG: hypothetical protein HOJ35_08395 [Bdellovibrionales bacterium]|nr:hypothetical protein [Bdellovibrionales bacterium]
MIRCIHWTKIEKFIGSLKFAVIIISMFSIFMVVGTFVESYSGTEFANRLIYKSWPFFLVQGCMLLSIIYATFLRLPFVKRLYGFYIIHTGLIILAMGSIITYYSGLDGTITLSPNNPVRTIDLPKQIIKINYVDKKEIIEYDLPYNAYSTDINKTYNNIELKRYYPFSKNTLIWTDSPKESGLINSSSTQYLIYNKNIDQKFTLSLNKLATKFETSISMGLLNIHYLPSEISNCISLNNKSKYIFWNIENNQCFTPESRDIEIKETNENKTFLVLNDNSKILLFFPDFGPYPLDKDFNLIQNSSIRILSIAPFEQDNHLFLFGEKMAYFQDGKWKTYPLPTTSDAQLPWMNFKLKILKHSTTSYPELLPKYVVPIQDNGSLIKGQQQAIQIQIKDNTYWITNNEPLNILINNEKVKIELTNKKIQMPFELSLSNFKMKKNPGTNTPASFESFVRLFDESGSSKHHIFMNNPLKYDHYTFYQASYFKTRNGDYGSALSVNVDQGRVLKYLGCIFLVFGAMLHFYLRSSKKKKITGVA